MEYIQCTHCHKKYRVNAQVRAAVGRMVKCKDCGEPIEIIIFQSPDEHGSKTETKHTANEQPDKSPIQKNTPEPQTSSSTQAKSHPHPKKRAGNSASITSDSEQNNSRKKITFSAILGVVIVLVSAYGFFQGRSQQADALHAHTGIEKGEQVQSNKVTSSNNAVQSLPKASKNHLQSPKNHANQQAAHYSKTCKEAAAQQWLIDYKMSHGQETGREYMILLDQGMQTSALIRQHCGSFQVVNEVLQAAQEGQPPEWLQHTIQLMTQTGDDVLDAPRF